MLAQKIDLPNRKCLRPNPYGSAAVTIAAMKQSTLALPALVATTIFRAFTTTLLRTYDRGRGQGGLVAVRESWFTCGTFGRGGPYPTTRDVIWLGRGHTAG